MMSVAALTPTALRQRVRARFGPGKSTGSGVLTLRLPARAPFAYEGLFGHLAASGAHGVEEVRDGAYRRTLRLAAGNGVVSLTPQPDHVRCELILDDFRDLSTAIARCRRLLDLDADPEAVVDALSRDGQLTALISKAPGQRIPRTVDESELALRVVIGQQISVKAARTHAGRLAQAYGSPIEDAKGGLTHVFPSIEQLAELDPAHLALPKSRQRTFMTLVGALADGSVVLDSGCDWNRAREQLLALPGIGPWTAEVIAMRGLGDPDAFPVTDLGVLAAARTLGLPADPWALTEHSAGWRPWRAYATQHLWTALEHDVNYWPPKTAAKDT
jgi:AraC family transcriptional regulator of adaptative response / DNA-3-methyladenine glycosylase II